MKVGEIFNGGYIYHIDAVRKLVYVVDIGYADRHPEWDVSPTSIVNVDFDPNGVEWQTVRPPRRSQADFYGTVYKNIDWDFESSNHPRTTSYYNLENVSCDGADNWFIPTQEEWEEVFHELSFYNNQEALDLYDTLSSQYLRCNDYSYEELDLYVGYRSPLLGGVVYEVNDQAGWAEVARDWDSIYHKREEHYFSKNYNKNGTLGFLSQHPYSSFSSAIRDSGNEYDYENGVFHVHPDDNDKTWESENLTGEDLDSYLKITDPIVLNNFKMFSTERRSGGNLNDYIRTVYGVALFWGSWYHSIQRAEKFNNEDDVVYKGRGSVYYYHNEKTQRFGLAEAKFTIGWYPLGWDGFNKLKNQNIRISQNEPDSNYEVNTGYYRGPYWLDYSESNAEIGGFSDDLGGFIAYLDDAPRNTEDKQKALVCSHYDLHVSIPANYYTNTFPYRSIASGDFEYFNNNGFFIINRLPHQSDGTVSATSQWYYNNYIQYNYSYFSFDVAMLYGNEYGLYTSGIQNIPTGGYTAGNLNRDYESFYAGLEPIEPEYDYDHSIHRVKFNVVPQYDAYRLSSRVSGEQIISGGSGVETILLELDTFREAGEDYIENLKQDIDEHRDGYFYFNNVENYIVETPYGDVDPGYYHTFWASMGSRSVYDYNDDGDVVSEIKRLSISFSLDFTPPTFITESNFNSLTQNTTPELTPYLAIYPYKVYDNNGNYISDYNSWELNPNKEAHPYNCKEGLSIWTPETRNSFDINSIEPSSRLKLYMVVIDYKKSDGNGGYKKTFFEHTFKVKEEDYWGDTGGDLYSIHGHYSYSSTDTASLFDLLETDGFDRNAYSFTVELENDLDPVWLKAGDRISNAQGTISNVSGIETQWDVDYVIYRISKVDGGLDEAVNSYNLIWDETDEIKRNKDLDFLSKYEGSNSSLIFSGYDNTLGLAEVYNNPHYAAQAALNYSSDGKDDWFIPSWNEMVAVKKAVGIQEYENNEGELNEYYTIINPGKKKESKKDNSYAFVTMEYEGLSEKYQDQNYYRSIPIKEGYTMRLELWHERAEYTNVFTQFWGWLSSGATGSEQRECENRFYYLDRTYTATQDYDDIIDFWNGDGLGNTINTGTHPDSPNPIGNSYSSTLLNNRSDVNHFKNGAQHATNRYAWYKDEDTNEIRFIITSTNSCGGTGLMGGGDAILECRITIQAIDRYYNPGNFQRSNYYTSTFYDTYHPITNPSGKRQPLLFHMERDYDYLSETFGSGSFWPYSVPVAENNTKAYVRPVRYPTEYDLRNFTNYYGCKLYDGQGSAIGTLSTNPNKIYDVALRRRVDKKFVNYDKILFKSYKRENSSGNEEVVWNDVYESLNEDRKPFLIKAFSLDSEVAIADVEGDEVPWTYIIPTVEGLDPYREYTVTIPSLIDEVPSGTGDVIPVVERFVRFRNGWNMKGFPLDFSEVLSIKITDTSGGWHYLEDVEENKVTVTDFGETYTTFNTRYLLEKLFDNDQLIIVKNNQGEAYLPEWDFDGIGPISPHEGLHVKMQNVEPIGQPSINLISHNGTNSTASELQVEVEGLIYTYNWSPDEKKIKELELLHGEGNISVNSDGRVIVSDDSLQMSQYSETREFIEGKSGHYYPLSTREYLFSRPHERYQYVNGRFVYKLVGHPYSWREYNINNEHQISNYRIDEFLEGGEFSWSSNYFPYKYDSQAVANFPIYLPDPNWRSGGSEIVFVSKPHGDVVETGKGDIFSERFVLKLTSGWNLINWPIESSRDAVLVFEDLVSDLIILKDYHGQAYLPEWGFNGVGDLEPGQSYQVKMKNTHSTYELIIS